MIYITTLPFIRPCSFKLVQNNEFEKRGEGSGYGLFEVVFRHLIGSTEEDHEISISRYELGASRIKTEVSINILV
jgi:hypothetical protein